MRYHEVPDDAPPPLFANLALFIAVALVVGLALFAVYGVAGDVVRALVAA